MRIRRLVTIAIGLLLLATFVDRFVLLEMLAARLAAPLLVAGLVGLAATGAGFLARRMRPSRALDFAVGYPLFGTVCFLVAALRVHAWTMVPLTLLFAVAGCVALWHAVRDRDQSRLAAPFPGTPVEIFALSAIVLVLVCGFVSAQAPPSTLDELAYHLAIPHAWVAEGRAVDLPLISHSYFPLGIESADLPALTLLGPLSGGIASHLLHLLSACVAAVLLFRRSRSLLVTAAVVATPALALAAGWSLVDWPLLAICLAFLEDDDATKGAALAAGLLTKYTFLPFAIVVTAVNRRWRGLAAGAAVGSVFFARNLLLTGNPFAPFFGSDSPHVGGYRMLTLGSYVFDGRFVDESLGASLLALLPAIGGWVAVGLLAAGFLFWLSAPSARLLLPYFATAATSARPSESRPLRWILVAAIAAQLLLVVYYVDRTEVFSTISGKASDEEFLARNRASYGAVSWLNGVLPQRSRILVVGLNETYWFSGRVRGGGNFDGPRVSAYLEAPTPEALRARLVHDGITHVAVVSLRSQTAVAQKAEERQTHLSFAAQRSLSQMLDRYASNLASRDEAVLFTLKRL